MNLSLNGEIYVVFILNSLNKLSVSWYNSQAVQNWTYGCVHTLLKHGADPNHMDKNGNTSLHYAVSEDNQMLAKYLLKYSADMEQKNKVQFMELYSPNNLKHMCVTGNKGRINSVSQEFKGSLNGKTLKQLHCLKYGFKQGCFERSVKIQNIQGQYLCKYHAFYICSRQSFSFYIFFSLNLSLTCVR